MWLLHFIVASAAPLALFESEPVRPLALTEDGRLLVTNLPDGRLASLDPTSGDVLASIPVGVDPVSVAVHGDAAWVVNHLSDAVSVVDLSTDPPRIVGTRQVGDEPRDIVFAAGRAYVTTAHRGQANPEDTEPHTPSVN